MNRTLAIIKPDAVAAQATGAILSRIEEEGFRILGLRMVHMSRRDAEGFYAVHRERPFFDDLVSFMSSGPAIVIALEAEGAIDKWRTVIGATDPAKAADGTIRKQFATNIEKNAVHGSDAPETAAVEIAYWFQGVDLVC
jgi:nucleoside-diphosphate kinase